MNIISEHGVNYATISWNDEEVSVGVTWPDGKSGQLTMNVEGGKLVVTHNDFHAKTFAEAFLETLFGVSLGG